MQVASDELKKWYKGYVAGRQTFADRPDVSGSKKDKTKFPLAEMERRIRVVQKCSRRQSDRDMPRTPFRNGVTALTKMSGQEYPGLCLLAAVCMKGILHRPKDSGSEIAAKREIERNFVLVLWLGLSLEKVLSAEEVSETELVEIEGKLQKYRRVLRTSVGILRETLSKTGMRVSKNEGLKHFVRQIRKFGSTLNSFGGFLEEFLKEVIKKPTKTTSRKHKSYREIEALLNQKYYVRS